MTFVNDKSKTMIRMGFEPMHVSELGDILYGICML